MINIFYTPFTRWKTLFASVLVILSGRLTIAQTNASDSVLATPSLENVIGYALKHQPKVQQSLLDQSITESQIKNKLADWYPQINFNYNYSHAFKLQPNFFPDQNGDGGYSLVRFGVPNSSLAQFAMSQTLFNRDVLLAKSSAADVRTQAAQNTSSAKIDVVATVSKAFYDVLSTTQQIKLGQGDIIRLKQSLKTAYDQYSGGLVDKTDYKRATITLKNTEATLKSNIQLLTYKVEYLKQLMGYPPKEQLAIKYDTLQMENEISLDTTQSIDYKNRIEYQLLQTQRNLQQANVNYSKWAYLPTVALNGAYNFYYITTDKQIIEKNIYSINRPYSNAAITLSVPIFQGGKRNSNIRIQKYTMRRLDLDIVTLKNSINSQYAQSMAAYKSNLITYLTLKENVQLAKEVYDIIQLQYKTGIKNYLEVITAETDLRTARTNYFNALYAVLSSKIDVERTLGQINY